VATVVTVMVRNFRDPHLLWTERYRTGIMGGLIIGLPPVMNFGSEELKQEVLPEVFSGKKFVCLAISEAHAGSDVFGLQTYAKKTEDGKHWIINGTKKWITGGMYAD